MTLVTRHNVQSPIRPTAHAPSRRQPQRGRVHAVAFAGGAGAVGEDMA